MSFSLSILIIDDNSDQIALLTRRLQSVEALTCTIHAASDSQEAWETLQRETIDIMFLDYRLSRETGKDVLKRFRNKGINKPVVVLTAHGDEYVAAEVTRAGADDYLSKRDLDSKRLEQVLIRMAESVRKNEAEEAGREAVQRRIDLLTPREKEVMEFVITGKTNKEIAEELYRSENTIKIHRSRVMQKMQARTPADLTRMVLGIHGTNNTRV